MLKSVVKKENNLKTDFETSAKQAFVRNKSKKSIINYN